MGGAEEIIFHRALGARQDGGDLAHFAAVKMAQHEHGALLFRKRSQRRADALTQFLIQERMLRIRAGLLRVQKPLAVFIVRGFERLMAPAPALFAKIDAMIHHDAVQPRRELAFKAEGGKFPKNLQENVLIGVFRVSLAVEHLKSELQHQPVVHGDELRKRAGAALLRLPDESVLPFVHHTSALDRPAKKRFAGRGGILLIAASNRGRCGGMEVRDASNPSSPKSDDPFFSRNRENMVQQNSDKRKAFIAIAGNIGVGKTTLTNFLTARQGWQGFLEKEVANPYLADFYGDMKRWAFHSQLFFLKERMKDHLRIQQSGQICVQDRTIYEDAEIFARNLFERGMMEARDFACYTDIYQAIALALRPPDVIVYLRASIWTLISRIRHRGRDYEQNIDKEYLAQLNIAYDHWAKRMAQQHNVITIETDTIDVHRQQRALEEMVGRVLEAVERCGS